MDTIKFRVESAAIACKRAAFAGERDPPIIKPKGKTCQGVCCIGANKIEVYDNIVYINDVKTSLFADSLRIGAFPTRINDVVISYNSELSRLWKYT